MTAFTIGVDAGTGRVAAVLPDGTVRVDRPTATVDGLLRDPFIVGAKLRELADNLGMCELFTRPINDRIADRARILRNGRTSRRYRGVHRSGCWTVDALTEAVIAQRSARRADHRRALRRPSTLGEMLWIGDRMTSVRFYGVVPGEPGEPATATLTIDADDAVLSLPAIAGPTGVPADADDAPTGPIVYARPYADPLSDTSRWTAVGNLLDDSALTVEYHRWPFDMDGGRHRQEDEPC